MNYKFISRLMTRFSNLFIFLSVFAFGYLVYDQTEKEYARLCRKNPAEFENDV